MFKKISGFIFLIYLILPSNVFAHGSDESTMMYNMMGYGAGAWGNWIFMILFWILVILGVIALIKWLAGNTFGERHNSAVEILQERFAKGEINQAEFAAKAKLLKK